MEAEGACSEGESSELSSLEELEVELLEEEEEEEDKSCRRRRVTGGLVGGEGDRGSLEMSLRRGGGKPRDREAELARQAERSEEVERMGSARKMESAEERLWGIGLGAVGQAEEFRLT